MTRLELLVAALALLVATPLATAQQAARSDTGTPSAVWRSAALPRVTDPNLEERTRQVAAQLRCPVCQGLSLADSPSELALEMKDVVRQQLAVGRTPEQVKAYFVAKYGEWILLEPPARGLNRVAYTLPVVAVVAGLALVWLMLGRWTRSGPEPGRDAYAGNPAD